MNFTGIMLRLAVVRLIMFAGRAILQARMIFFAELAAVGAIGAG